MKLSAATFAKYNTQKRKTLDRLTNKHRIKLVDVFKEHFESQEKQFVDALEGGRDDFKPSTQGLLEKIESVVRNHRNDVVYVGVSDGMQEVRPDNTLGHWNNYPAHAHIELTIVSLEQKKKRWQIVKKITDDLDNSKKAKKAVTEIAKSQLKQYLHAVADAYDKSADEFLNGGERKTAVARFSDYSDIFKELFRKTSFDAERAFRTETTAHFNDARIDYFKNNTDVDFVQIIAITDNRISKICDCRNDYIIPIAKSNQKKFKPPFHPNCRTIVSPLISYLYDKAEIERNLGSEFGKCEGEDMEGKPVFYKGHRAPPNVPLPVGWA